MAHSPTYEVRVRREIRDALAIDPIATIPELTERLNKRLSHSFDPRYIKKLTDKVAHQLIIESDRLRIEDRMKVTQENHLIVREELQAILHSGALSKDRVEAGKALVMLDLAVFKAEIETGCSRSPSTSSSRNFATTRCPTKYAP